jgi:hypothetical protein
VLLDASCAGGCRPDDAGVYAPQEGAVVDEQDQREIERIRERLDVIGKWLTQMRCGDDAECVAAKMLEIADLERRRDSILSARRSADSLTGE